MYRVCTTTPIHGWPICAGDPPAHRAGWAAIVLGNQLVMVLHNAGWAAAWLAVGAGQLATGMARVRLYSTQLALVAVPASGWRVDSVGRGCAGATWLFAAAVQPRCSRRCVAAGGQGVPALLLFSRRRHGRAAAALAARRR